MAVHGDQIGEGRPLTDHGRNEATETERPVYRERFLEDLIEGLSRTPKEIPSKYLYDDRGSRLFNRICELEEYYPARTEMGIMEREGAEIAARLGSRCLVVEPGAGAGVKTRRLLDALDRPAGYVAIDVSREYLRAVESEIGAARPSLSVVTVHADFTQDVELPLQWPGARRTVVYFPGSTIGNFASAAAVGLLRRMRGWAGRHGAVLLGADLDKSRSVLEAAYDDREGVTAEFNLNLLVRANRTLGADFDVASFTHEAVYNESKSRVEMYLRSRVAQTVAVAGHRFELGRDEAILTELSHKYTLDRLAAMGAEAGLGIERVWTDPDELFAVLLLTPDARARF